MRLKPRDSEFAISALIRRRRFLTDLGQCTILMARVLEFRNSAEINSLLFIQITRCPRVHFNVGVRAIQQQVPQHFLPVMFQQPPNHTVSLREGHRRPEDGATFPAPDGSLANTKTRFYKMPRRAGTKATSEPRTHSGRLPSLSKRAINACRERMVLKSQRLKAYLINIINQKGVFWEMINENISNLRAPGAYRFEQQDC